MNLRPGETKAIESVFISADPVSRRLNLHQWDSDSILSQDMAVNLVLNLNYLLTDSMETIR